MTHRQSNENYSSKNRNWTLHPTPTTLFAPLPPHESALRLRRATRAWPRVEWQFLDGLYKHP